MKLLPTLKQVYQAQHRIRSVIRPTALWEASALAHKTGAQSIHLKMECHQPTGSFKLRGASNKILGLSPDDRSRGVITFSTGNHGLAVAYVAGRHGIPATVCLSEHVPAYRAQAVRRLGAAVAVSGRSQDDAERHYRRLVRERGLVPVVPFDDPQIIAGQGTIALEILSALPHTQTLIVQISGGGLAAGIAMAAKTIDPAIKIIGVSLQRSPAMVAGLKAGRPVPIEEKSSLADSLLGGIGKTNRYTLPMVDRYVDEHVLIDEETIAAGMFYLFEEHRVIAEGAAAAGIGAVLQGNIDVTGQRVAAVVTGGTVDSQTYLQVIQNQLERKKHG